MRFSWVAMAMGAKRGILFPQFHPQDHSPWKAGGRGLRGHWPVAGGGAGRGLGLQLSPP